MSRCQDPLASMLWVVENVKWRKKERKNRKEKEKKERKQK